MGLFHQSKKEPQKSPEEMAREAAGQVFDDEFREYLRDRGRAYFERIIDENGVLFKQDLDATVAHINTELRQHVARQLDDQFAEISRVNAELREHISKQLEDQFAQFSRTMEGAQEKALESLNRSALALEEQHKQLSAMLEMSINKQQTILVDAFQQNMARIIEHYLLTAVGEKYDLKAQLPSIIQQMEANKQAIVDDMKL